MVLNRKLWYENSWLSEGIILSYYTVIIITSKWESPTGDKVGVLRQESLYCTWKYLCCPSKLFCFPTETYVSDHSSISLRCAAVFFHSYQFLAVAEKMLGNFVVFFAKSLTVSKDRRITRIWRSLLESKLFQGIAKLLGLPHPSRFRSTHAFTWDGTVYMYIVYTIKRFRSK